LGISIEYCGFHVPHVVFDMVESAGFSVPIIFQRF